MRVSIFPIRTTGAGGATVCGALLLAALPHLGVAAPVSLLDRRLAVDGAWHVQRTPTRIILRRHADATLADPTAGISAAARPYALTQPGVQLRFRTDSPRVELRFAAHAGGAAMSLHQGFAVRIDGAAAFSADTLSFGIDSPGPGLHDYVVSLPSYYAVELAGMTLDDGHALVTPLDRRLPVYVAIGDSITQGLGQQSAADLGYASVVARWRGWRLVNLGVSGAAIGPAMAAELDGRRVAIVSVALGFNDWYWHSDPLDAVARRYDTLLAGLRRAQPHAEIVAIAPLLSTAAPGRARAQYSLDQLRGVIGAAVARRRAAGDRRLHLVAGDDLSDAAMLVDGIHLSAEGAARYGSALAGVLPAVRTSP